MHCSCSRPAETSRSPRTNDQATTRARDPELLPIPERPAATVRALTKALCLRRAAAAIAGFRALHLRGRPQKVGRTVNRTGAMQPTCCGRIWFTPTYHGRGVGIGTRSERAAHSRGKGGKQKEERARGRPKAALKSAPPAPVSTRTPVLRPAQSRLCRKLRRCDRLPPKSGPNEESSSERPMLLAWARSTTKPRSTSTDNLAEVTPARVDPRKRHPSHLRSEETPGCGSR